MEKKKLIEKLNDLATFFILHEKTAKEEMEQYLKRENKNMASFCSGEAMAYQIGFNKLEKIIKEAKK